ncbi:MAG TPA: hypothetical protein VF597_04465 [Candidatus Saccharimonadales bacterium]|jgi:hypothetical protein
MQKHRFTIRIASAAIIAAGTLTVMTPAAQAAGDYGNASRSERLGCQPEAYSSLDDWALGRHGTLRPGIGHFKVLTRSSPSDEDYIRLCAITQHGSRTWNRPRFTKIAIYTQARGEHALSRRFWDSGRFRKHTDGRAITPARGRCAVFHGVIRHGGKNYQRMVTQFNTNPDKLCN